jgi:hypothetical protein
MRVFFSEKVIENQNRNFIFNNFFRKSYCLLYNVEKMVEPDRPQMVIMYGACALYAG